MQHTISVVFSATPTGMGRLIRFVTGHPYNHVSISLDPDLHILWSYARYHRNAPLYGGLVQESLLRYQGADLKLCRIPVSDAQYMELQNTLNAMWSKRERYIYNTAAALASLAGRAPALPHTHTCVSFVQEILLRLRCSDRLPCRPTVRALEQALAPCHWEYRTVTAAGQDWGEDAYPQRLSLGRSTFSTTRQFGRLAIRALGGT